MILSEGSGMLIWKIWGTRFIVTLRSTEKFSVTRQPVTPTIWLLMTRRGTGRFRAVKGALTDAKISRMK